MHDIYRDANITEVLLAREPLEELSKSLVELLIEFPENALLEQLLKTVRRILNFAVTSPLMKVLVGLEFLHGKLHDWDVNASRAVSLSSHSERIARLIGRWRKLELQSWPLIFYTRLQSHKLNAEKWWFHLYSLLEYNDISKINPIADGAPQKPEQALKEDKEVFLETMDGFVQTSNHGEFVARLDLLRTFYHQLASEVAAKFERSSSGDARGMSMAMRAYLADLLYNIHAYYQQFQDSIQDNLRNLRAPLEKKVNDFIKLARWDDVNYYALKASTEKSHRQLNKFSRHLEDLLRNPVSPLLEKPDDPEADNLECNNLHESLMLGPNERTSKYLLCDNAQFSFIQIEVASSLLRTSFSLGNLI